MATQLEAFRKIVGFAHAGKTNEFDPDDWYVGITEDPSERLYDGHSVSKHSGDRVYYKLASSNAARRVEAELLELGFDGGDGGGDQDAVFVYAYKKTWNTEP